MKSYEAVCALHPKLADEKIEAIIGKLEKKIKSAGGEVQQVKRWGKKKLTFTFKKAKGIDEAYYVLINFEGGKDTPKELEGLMKITEEIVRYLIVSSEGPPPVEAEEAAVAEEKVEIEPSMLIETPESKEETKEEEIPPAGGQVKEGS